MDSFVHLHTHSQYSQLDGASRIKSLVEKAAKDGQPALGLTDHGNMRGVPEFLSECKNHGINGIVGEELYYHPDRFDRTPRKSAKNDSHEEESADGKKIYYHLTALAENREGYQNLIKLSSLAFLEGYYYQPRVDPELLERHKKGIIVTTGCLGGATLQAMMNQGFDAACEEAGLLKDIFGPDNVLVELQNHGIPEQLKTNPELIRLAKKLGLRTLAAQDSHYIDQCDHESHDAMLCVGTGSYMSDPTRFRFHGDQHYFKTAEEMRYVFRELPEACDNTLRIAERCSVDISSPGYKIPKFPVPERYGSAIEYLTVLVNNGAKKRWGELTPIHQERLSYELGVIEEMGFSSYFLIVWDLIRYTRSQGSFPGPGRGSAAGCAVAYCLGITELDPIKYDLLFERFLNPSRVSLPDIDMDVEGRFRDELIRYTRDKYGDDRVCQIITFGTIKSRQAVRDAARVLGYEYSVGDKLAKSLPPLAQGRDTPLSACLTKSKGHEEGFLKAEGFRELYNSGGEYQKVVDIALGLEGLNRSDGIHAAGVVISDMPLTDYLPVQQKPPKKQGEDSPIVSQYDMHTVESLGLLKMDFLGLSNLDIISDTVRMVKENHGVTLDMNRVPLDDPATFELLQHGRTLGVFQLESDGMQSLVKRLKPTVFDDIAALVALYRPGPMGTGMHNTYADRKNGRETVKYLHEDAKETLEYTWGQCIYQEQLMRICQQFAGYSLAEADNMRKITGKKLPEKMAAEKEKFVAGCLSQGYKQSIADEWWRIIEPFSSYSFNKSHAYCYGFIAYQTAWLKANYPEEYMACLMTSRNGSHEKLRPLLNECRKMGIEVKPPDINNSGVFFSTTPKEPHVIRYGLACVLNSGEALSELVCEERANGDYRDFFDWCARVDVRCLNKRFVEAMIYAGAFDRWHSRNGLESILEQTLASCTHVRKNESVGQFDLFSVLEEAPEPYRVDVPDIPTGKDDILRLERKHLGLYVSDHPLSGLDALLDSRRSETIQELSGLMSGESVRVAGLVTDLEVKVSKRGAQYATFNIEDMDGVCRAVMFGKSFQRYGRNLSHDAVVSLDGKVSVDDKDDSVQIVVDRVIPLMVDETELFA